MTRDDELIGRLEEYLDDYLGQTSLPDAVRLAVRAQVPRTRQVRSLPGPLQVFGGVNRTFAIALILVALLVISIGLAVAGGLLRIDRVDRDDANPFALAGPVGHCDQTLPEGVVLTIIGWSGEEQLTIFEDGLSVTGYPIGWGNTARNGLEGTWSQRHLTVEGLSRLIRAITGSSLPGCQTFNYSGGYQEIRARTGADVYSIRLGPDVLETRVTTPSQAAAVDELVARLEDPDLGLPAGSWDEDQWHDYVPARWRFSLQFSGWSDREYPASDAIVLPDGSTLRTFGIEEPIDTLDPAARPQGLSMLRCAVTGPAEARAIGAILTEAGGSQDPSGWSFTDGAPVGDLGGVPIHNIVSVSVGGLLPPEPDCQSEAGPAATPTPAPAPSMPADKPAPLADACDYLSVALITDRLGPIQGETEHYPGWSTDWAFCWQPVAGKGLVIFASRRAIPGDRAAAQAKSLFGEVGFNADQIAGHDVFFNGCQANDLQCRAAIAISAPPHFVVISLEPGSQTTLRQLAEGLIAELER